MEPNGVRYLGARVIAVKNPDKRPERANVRNRLAETIVDPKVSEEYARETVALYRRLNNNTHPETAWEMRALAKTLRRQGKLAEAEQYYKEAKAVFGTSDDNSSTLVISTIANIGSVSSLHRDEAGLQELRNESRNVVQPPMYRLCALDPRRNSIGAGHCRIASWYSLVRVP